MSTVADGSWDEIVRESFALLIGDSHQGCWCTKVMSSGQSTESQLFVRAQTEDDGMVIELLVLERMPGSKASLWRVRVDAETCSKYVEAMFRKGSSLRQHALQLMRALQLSDSCSDASDKLRIRRNSDNPNQLILEIPHKYQTIRLKGHFSLELVVNEIPEALVSLISELPAAVSSEEERKIKFPKYSAGNQSQLTTQTDESLDASSNLDVNPDAIYEPSQSSSMGLSTDLPDSPAGDIGAPPPTLSRVVVGKKRRKDLVSGRRVSKKKKSGRFA